MLGEKRIFIPADVSDDLNVIRVSVARHAHEVGYQVPIENGQCVIPQPANDISDKWVTPCG